MTGTRRSGHPKTPSRTLEDILASCSDSLFPAQIGRAPVHLQSVDCDGDTPLHVLLRRNDTEAVLMLIAAGAKINAVGDSLYYAGGQVVTSPFHDLPFTSLLIADNLNDVEPLIASSSHATRVRIPLPDASAL